MFLQELNAEQSLEVLKEWLSDKSLTGDPKWITPEQYKVKSDKVSRDLVYNDGLRIITYVSKV